MSSIFEYHFVILSKYVIKPLREQYEIVKH